jgi:apolipoprotein N-acyltransferase
LLLYWKQIHNKSRIIMTAGISSQEANKKNVAVRIGVGLALSVLSGVMLLLAFPPYGVWPLVGDVSPGSGNTPFPYLGDWLGWLSLAGWIFFVVFEALENRRHKRAQEQEKANAAS